MHDLKEKPDRQKGHGHHPKGPKPPHGPKEREAAVALTVAILNAADASGSVEDVERIALDLYARVFDTLTQHAPSPR